MAQPPRYSTRSSSLGGSAGNLLTTLHQPQQYPPTNQSPALQARIAEKRAELEHLVQLRTLSATLAMQMEQLETKLATLADGTEAVAHVLANWQNVLRAISMASTPLQNLASQKQSTTTSSNQPPPPPRPSSPIQAPHEPDTAFLQRQEQHLADLEAYHVLLEEYRLQLLQEGGDGGGGEDEEGRLDAGSGSGGGGKIPLPVTLVRIPTQHYSSVSAPR